MNFLKKYGFSDHEIANITSHYEKTLISSILYKEKNVCLLLDFFKENDFDLKTLLLNRLDVFLIDFNYLMNKFQKYNEQELFNCLRNDFSLIDNLD